MATAAQLPLGQDRALRAGFFDTPDPGSAGEISIINKATAIVKVVTAGAENRALPVAGGFAVGTRLLVVGKTLAGAATITGAESSVVLSAAGDVAEFVVSESGASRVWRVLGNSQTAGVNFPVVLTYNFLATETAADAVAGVIALIGQLADAGLVDDTAVLNTAV